MARRTDPLKTLDELIDRNDPALPIVREWVAKARNPAELLPCDPADGDRTLLALQVTTHSTLGTIAHETGGLLIDDGWIRILGAGCARLPRDLARWNRMLEPERRLRGALLIGDDALGGFFAANGGAFGKETGKIHYLAPDSLQWESTDRGYSEFLGFLLEGDLGRFYEGTRWKSWRDEVATLAGDQGFVLSPPLSAEGPDVEVRARKVAPIEELWRLHTVNLARQLT